MGIMRALKIIAMLPLRVLAGNNNNQVDTSIYGMSLQRDWMYESSTISMKYLGCVWGYVDSDTSADLGCMENESEDGTSMWYMMANCRRAQVAYSLYASSGSTSCNKKDFKESFVSKNGISEFAYTLGTYGYNSPVSGNDVSSLPVCEADGYGYYMSVGCSSSGGFTIDRFTDAYCLSYYDTIEKLSNLDSAMSNLNCYKVYNSNTDSDPSYSVGAYLVAESGSCSEAESSLCTTNSFVQSAGTGGGYTLSSSHSSLSITNKVKYGIGNAMLLGSVVMFVGILFTNRRKRHALMHRKFRQSDGKEKKRSKSKSKKSSKGGSKRSSSRKKTSTNNGGIFA